MGTFARLLYDPDTPLIISPQTAPFLIFPNSSAQFRSAHFSCNPSNHCYTFPIASPNPRIGPQPSDPARCRPWLSELSMPRVPRTVTGKFELKYLGSTSVYLVEILPFDADIDRRPIRVDQALHDAVNPGDTVYVDESSIGVTVHLVAQ